MFRITGSNKKIKSGVKIEVELKELATNRLLETEDIQA